MSTTRPLGPKGPLPEVSPARHAPAPRTASEVSNTEDAPTHVADSVGTLQQTIVAGRDHVGRADAQMISELKEAIRNGTFKVNIDELAERLIADAFDTE